MGDRGKRELGGVGREVGGISGDRDWEVGEMSGDGGWETEEVSGDLGWEVLGCRGRGTSVSSWRRARRMMVSGDRGEWLKPSRVALIQLARSGWRPRLNLSRLRDMGSAAVVRGR